MRHHNEGRSSLPKLSQISLIELGWLAVEPSQPNSCGTFSSFSSKVSQSVHPPSFLRHHSICTMPAPTPLATSLSRNSAKRLVVLSSAILPVPLHITSAAAATRGHNVLSNETLSVSSPHRWTSPPTMRCLCSCRTPSNGLYEYMCRQCL